MSSEIIEIVAFNKSLEVTKSAMTASKAMKALQTLKGEIPIPKVCSDCYVKILILFSDSFGIVVVKLNYSLKNRNFLFCGLVECQNMWVRSLTKDFCLSGCIGTYTLVALDTLDHLKLTTLNQKIVTRRRIGRPQTTSSINRFLNQKKKYSNREQFLEAFLKREKGKNMCKNVAC